MYFVASCSEQVQRNFSGPVKKKSLESAKLSPYASFANMAGKIRDPALSAPPEGELGKLYLN
jgi:hypothetical protein